MAQIIEVTDINVPELAAFTRLTEAQLRNRLEPERGLFIAESPKVIGTALDAAYEPKALLMEHRHLEGQGRAIIDRCGDIPVYTGAREVLASLTGYALTRGVLCAMGRKPQPSVEEVCNGARRLAVLEGIVDTTNVGALFRAAAALGMDGILLSTGSSILATLSKNSMASTMTVPQIRPMKQAPTGLTASHPAVMPTRPAKAAL